MNFIQQTGAFTTADQALVNQNFALLSGLTQGQGTAYFVDAVNGKDSYSGTFPSVQANGADGPKATLAGAYNACSSLSTTRGKNDTVVVLADGGTTGTLRVDSAFTWAKGETHLVGICSPVLMSQRARLAPSSTTTAFANFFTISASGCVFQNLQWFQGFTTGTTSQIAVTVTGSRNYFGNCHIAGMGDAASAEHAGSRSLKIGASGSGENVFADCTIGVDTVTRSAANASVEFAGATARNVFRGCLFPFMTDDAGALGILGTGNGCVDRFNLFDNCAFINAIKSTSTGMTVLASFTTTTPGGMVIFKDCAMVGVTKFGDTNALANSYLNMPVISASAGGLMLAPT